MKVPDSLRKWFFVHFLLDYAVALPLFIFPRFILEFVGATTIDPLATRIVAAALFAIGGISLVSKNASLEVYKNLLILKIIWSTFAILGILITIFTTGSNLLSWLTLVIFAIFSSIWIYYYKTVSR